jgi:hypothetical protein
MPTALLERLQRLEALLEEVDPTMSAEVNAQFSLIQACLKTLLARIEQQADQRPADPPPTLDVRRTHR